MKVRSVGKVPMINLGKQPILDASRGARNAMPEWTADLPRRVVNAVLLAPVAILVVLPRPLLGVFRLFRTGHYVTGALLTVVGLAYAAAVARDIVRGGLSRVTLALLLVVWVVFVAVCIGARSVPLFLWNAF